MMENDLQIVACTLAKEEYALDIGLVQEIIRMVDITRVPHAPLSVEGVINLRGRVIPIIDLRRRFDLTPRQNTERTRIVIIKLSETFAGFVVDGVSEVLRLSETAIEPPPSLEQKNATYFSGVGKIGNRLLILLNLNKILEDVTGV